MSSWKTELKCSACIWTSIRKVMGKSFWVNHNSNYKNVVRIHQKLWKRCDDQTSPYRHVVFFLLVSENESNNTFFVVRAGLCQKLLSSMAVQQMQWYEYKRFIKVSFFSNMLIAKKYNKQNTKNLELIESCRTNGWYAYNTVWRQCGKIT